MRPQIFASLGKKPVEGAIRLILYGISRLCLGVLLFLAAKQMQHLHLHPQILFVCLTILLLVSYSLILHFGILSISAGVWRLLGVKTYLLFKSPLQSTSLSEFWSKRWNIAFSEMISIAIYRPLKNNVGPAGIVILSFIFSGLLHESAISLPVEQGFGLPLLYFAIQAAAILLENIFKKKNLSFLNNIVLARLWVYTWVILPAPLLFHIYFIKGVVLPLAGLG
jgi:alginate O-acetyltransferase complex protein AlgI